MVTITKMENSEGYLIQRVKNNKATENISRNTFGYEDIIELVENIITKSVVNEENENFVELDITLLNDLSDEVCDHCNIFEEVFIDIAMKETGEFVYAFAIDEIGEDSEVFSEEEIRQLTNIVVKAALYVLLRDTDILEYND